MFQISKIHQLGHWFIICIHQTASIKHFSTKQQVISCPWTLLHIFSSPKKTSFHSSRFQYSIFSLCHQERLVSHYPSGSKEFLSGRLFIKLLDDMPQASWLIGHPFHCLTTILQTPTLGDWSTDSYKMHRLFPLFNVDI